MVFPWFSQVFPRTPRRDLRLGLDLGGRGSVPETPGPGLYLGDRGEIMDIMDILENGDGDIY